MYAFIIRFTIILVYYILGAYATTDMLRLLKGSKLSINATDCYCPICGHKISLYHQIPIVSYFINRRSCPYCKSHIPISEIFLETFILIVSTLVCIVFDFRFIAFFINLSIYEGTKVFLILKKGKREENFVRNLLCSVLNNSLQFGLVAFLFLIVKIVGEINAWK